MELANAEPHGMPEWRRHVRTLSFLKQKTYNPDTPLVDFRHLLATIAYLTGLHRIQVGCGRKLALTSGIELLVDRVPSLHVLK